MTIDDNNTVIFSDEEFSMLQKMLKGISSRYHGWSNLHKEDIEMELWIKALEVIKRTERMDMNLLARCAFNKALDMCRSAKTTVANVSIYDIDYMDKKIEEEANYTRQTTDDMSYLVNIEILNLFEQGTKEYEYVYTLIDYLGLVGNESKHVYEDCRMEKAVAIRLGYSDDTSQGYRKLKNRVRTTVRDLDFLDGLY